MFNLRNKDFSTSFTGKRTIKTREIPLQNSAVDSKYVILITFGPQNTEYQVTSTIVTLRLSNKEL